MFSEHTTVGLEEKEPIIYLQRYGVVSFNVSGCLRVLARCCGRLPLTFATASCSPAGGVGGKRSLGSTVEWRPT